MLDLNKGPPKVLLVTPHNGSVHPACMLSITQTLRKTPNDVALVDWQQCAGSNIAENQAELAGCAKERGADYILSVENDMAFPAEALQLLLASGKDIIGCTYPFKDFDLLPKLLAEKITGKDRGAALRYMGKELDGSPITFESLAYGKPEGQYVRQMEFIPMGLTLISLKAIETVENYRTSKCNLPLPEGTKASAFVHGEAYAPDYNPKRTITTTTDSTFCHNAREAGLEIWMDGRLSLLVEHRGDASYAIPSDAWNAP